MKRFSANYIFPANGAPIKGGIIVLDNNNSIVDIIDPQGDSVELESMEFHNGVIVPGFVNAHCHLELSHLRGQFRERVNGISGFVSQIRTLRASTQEEIQKAIKQALHDLEQNGTVAVGDICNTADTFTLKLTSKLFFHNFIELFSLIESEAEQRLNKAKDLLSESLSNSHSSSIVPHATYSISNKLWNLIDDELRKKESLISIHYGESQQEYDFLSKRKGVLADSFNALGIADGIAPQTTPLEIVKTYLPKQSSTLFVHNTFAQREEVEAIINQFAKPYFVTCPSSNLFIEGRLPDVLMLRDLGACIAIGTDSYASSNTLSIYDQVLILIEKFPELSFTEVIQWSTLNGAKALGVDHIYGSIGKGKKPGLNLITNFDFARMRPTDKSRVKRLV